MKAKKQLEIVFKEILEKYFGNTYYDFTIDSAVKELLKEVKR